MSHFCTVVFFKKGGKTAKELLAPFNENIIYEPYVEYTREQAIAKVRKDFEEYKNNVYAEYLADPNKYEEKYKNNPGHIDYIKNIFPKRLNWTDDECYCYEAQFYEPEMTAENGDLLSTYNPKSKWDYYTVGGRWDKFLKTKYAISVNAAYVYKVDWSKSIPFAFITPDGEWHEKGKMGMFAMVDNEKMDRKWESEFMEFVNSLDSDVAAIVIDCHI